VIAKIGEAIVGMAHFIESKVSKPGLTVKVDVYEGTTKIVDDDAATEIGTSGVYRYSLSGASVDANTTYLFVFKTATSTVDQQHIAALYVTPAWVDDVATLGAGALTFTYTVTSSVDATPISDVDVWVSTDSGGSNIVASGRTNASGIVTFYLDAGTYYLWRQKAGYNFTNPDTEVVS
jgi:hypothetical protein